MEVAWAAGLFDGEGSIRLRNGRPILQMKMCDRECIERFGYAVGAPQVLGPYKNRTGEKDGYPRSDYYVWTSRADDSLRVLLLLWPWLSSIRRDRAVEVGFAIPYENEEAA